MFGTTRSTTTPGIIDILEMERYILEEQERYDQYARNYAAYDGMFPDSLKPRIRKDGSKVDFNVKSNFIKPLVLTGVSLLAGTPPRWEVPIATDGEATNTDSPDEVWLKECLRVNSFPRWLLEQAKNGSITGTMYARFEPPDIDLVTGFPVVDGSPASYPHVKTLDSTWMAVITDPRDSELVTNYVWKHLGKDWSTGKTVVYRQITALRPDGLWDIVDQWAYLGDMQTVYVSPSASHNLSEVAHRPRRGENAQVYSGGTTATARHPLSSGVATEKWVTMGDVVTWPFKWAPILHAQNMPNPGSPYGEADIDDNLINNNEKRNFLMSNYVKTMYFHAHPKTWASGVTAGGLDWDIDSTLAVGNDMAKFGQLSPAVGGDEYNQALTRMDDDRHEVSSTPAILLGRPDQYSQDPSGVALYQRMRPAIERTFQKRTTFGPHVVETLRRLFELGKGRADVIVDLTWHDLVPKDLLVQAQAYQLHQAGGWASAQTISKKLDYPESEMELVRKEKEEQMAQEAEMFEQQAKVTAQYAPKPNSTTPAGGGGK